MRKRNPCESTTQCESALHDVRKPLSREVRSMNLFAGAQTASIERYDDGGTWPEDPSEALTQRAERILALMRSGRRKAAQRKITVTRTGDVTFTRSTEPKRLNRCIEAIRQELDSAYYSQNFETGGLPAFQVPVTLSFGRGIAQRLSDEWEVNFEKLKEGSNQIKAAQSITQENACLTMSGGYNNHNTDGITTGGWTTWSTQETIVLKTKSGGSNNESDVASGDTVNDKDFQPGEQTKDETSFFCDLPVVPTKPKTRIPMAKAVYHLAALKSVPAEKEKDTTPTFKCLKVDTQRLEQMIRTTRERRVMRLSARAAQLCDEREARGPGYLEFADLTTIETLQKLWIRFETLLWDFQRCSSALLSRSRNSR